MGPEIFFMKTELHLTKKCKEIKRKSLLWEELK